MGRIGSWHCRMNVVSTGRGNLYLDGGTKGLIIMLGSSFKSDDCRFGNGKEKSQIARHYATDTVPVEFSYIKRAKKLGPV
ncbi:hypothetical protein L1049_020277 [Liquidambar formosana]|uniref:Uncharacterized protein n=1 Tax=Liquidambar formosana TaxID=63359 RepID=A0AAP0X793_LIQFO